MVLAGRVTGHTASQPPLSPVVYRVPFSCRNTCRGTYHGAYWASVMRLLPAPVGKGPDSVKGDEDRPAQPRPVRPYTGSSPRHRPIRMSTWRRRRGRRPK